MSNSTQNQKLTETILYIARRCETAFLFGKVKLNKILFFADARSYFERGEPITWTTYVKQNFGPVPAHMDEILRGLETDRVLYVEERSMPDMTMQKRPVALRAANLSVFSGHDIVLLDETIDWIRGMSANQVSELSHNSVGWIAARMGEEFPLSTVLIPNPPIQPSEEEIAFGRRLAAGADAR